MQKQNVQHFTMFTWIVIYVSLLPVFLQPCSPAPSSTPTSQGQWNNNYDLSAHCGDLYVHIHNQNHGWIIEGQSLANRTTDPIAAQICIRDVDHDDIHYLMPVSRSDNQGNSVYVCLLLHSYNYL